MGEHSHHQVSLRILRLEVQAHLLRAEGDGPGDGEGSSPTNGVRSIGAVTTTPPPRSIQSKVSRSGATGERSAVECQP